MFMESAGLGSREVASAALRVAISANREEEKHLQAEFANRGIYTAGVDFGGEFISSVTKIIERSIVAAKREGIIKDSHVEEGAVAGAAKEAVSQIVNKAIGLNVGGKLAIARSGDHVSVAIFFGVGLLHLNEMVVGLGHRVI